MNRAVKGIIILLIILEAITFTACESIKSYVGENSSRNGSEPDSKKTQNEKITLKLWHIWTTDSESNRYPIEMAIKKWNNSNPDIKVEAEATENETYKIKLRTAMAVNETPDIFYSWGAGFAKPFVEAGKVLPLDEYLDDGTKEKLIPGSLKYFTYDGKVYGLPVYMIAGVLYCNMELFEKCDLEIPETFGDLLNVIEVFNKNGIIPMTVGEKDGWPGIFYQNILAIRTAGIERCNNALNKQESFFQPQFIESAEKLQELVRAGAFDERAMQLTRYESEMNFRNGKVAMYYNGSWVAGTLDAEDSPVKGKIAVRNFPSLENSKGEQNGFVGGAIDTFMVSSRIKHKEQTVRAFKTIVESFCKESYLAGAGFPAWKLDNVDENYISPLAMQISRLIKGSSGFVLAWDTHLAAAEAQTHIELVAELFSEKITPEEFAREMQKINVP